MILPISPVGIQRASLFSNAVAWRHCQKKTNGGRGSPVQIESTHMLDNTSSTVAAPEAAPVTREKTKRTRGVLNQKHTRALNRAEQIVAAAQNEERTAALAAREISKDIVDQLQTDVGAARDKATEAVVSTTARRTATVEEAGAAKALLGGLNEVQKAAKQKSARTNRIALTDYFIGGSLNGSRPNLMQTSQTILDKVAVDALPGVTPAKIKTLKAARQTWIDANMTQTSNATAARTQRAELKTMLKSIEDRKVTIQLAADAEWPHTDEANAGLRREFGLTATRPLKA